MRFDIYDRGVHENSFEMLIHTEIGRKDTPTAHDLNLENSAYPDQSETAYQLTLSVNAASAECTIQPVLHDDGWTSNHHYNKFFIKFRLMETVCYLQIYSD